MSVPGVAVRVVVFGDHRRALWLDPWRVAGALRGAGRARSAILARLAEERAALVVSTGDLVPSASAAAWARVDADLSSLRASGAVVEAVPGNHETYGWIPRSARPRSRMALFLRRFPREGGLRWGRCDAGAARFLLLDSNEKVLTGDEQRAQEVWLEREIESADRDPGVKLLFAVWHHPPFTNTTKYGDDRFSARSFLPRLRNAAKLGAVLCGHVHGYERFFAESIHFVVSGGGGARAHRFPADHARWRHTPAFDATGLPHVHYMVLEITERRAAACVWHGSVRHGETVWLPGDAFAIEPRGR